MSCEPLERDRDGRERLLGPPDVRDPRPWLAASGQPHRILQRGGQSPWLYLRHMLVHPLHFVFVGTAIFLALMSASLWWVLFAVLLEVLAVTIIPRLPLFQRCVDEHTVEVERAAGDRARASLLVQMDRAHRLEVETLELLVYRIRENAARCGGAVLLLLDERAGLDRLLTSYVRLAIRHRATREALEMTDRRALQGEIEHLASLESKGGSERIRKLVRQRLEVASRRAERWDENRRNLEATAHQLATLRNLVYLIHEQAMSLLDAPNATDEIDRLLADIEENESALREIAALGTNEEVEERVEAEMEQRPQRWVTADILA